MSKLPPDFHDRSAPVCWRWRAAERIAEGSDRSGGDGRTNRVGDGHV